MNNMTQIMKQAKLMQEKMEEIKKKVESTEIEGNSGGGVVKVLVDGKHNVKKISIDPTLIKKDEIEILEDLLIAAINDAKEKGEIAAQEEMKQVTGGLPLPPGIKLPF